MQQTLKADNIFRTKNSDETRVNMKYQASISKTISNQSLSAGNYKWHFQGNNNYLFAITPCTFDYLSDVRDVR